MLGEILTDPGEAEREIYAPNERYPALRGFNVLYFHFMAQSTAALIRIGNAHESLRARIAEIFRKAFADGTYAVRLTNRPPVSVEANYVMNLKSIAEKALRGWTDGKEFQF